MLRKIIGFSVIMMVLSIFAAQNDISAYIDGQGYCDASPGWVQASTENGLGEKCDQVDYMSVTLSGYHYNGTVGPVTAENYNCIAVITFIDTPASYSSTYGGASASHYIYDDGDSWSGTSSASY